MQMELADLESAWLHSDGLESWQVSGKQSTDVCVAKEQQRMRKKMV